MPRPTLRLATPVVALAAALLLAAPALAGPPAAIPDADTQRAGNAFERFASNWMGKMKRAERDNQRSPKRKAGRITYRGYAEGFETELKPTGHPSAPYVGILRYREHLYECSDAAAKDCQAVASTPVTEIFRFQNGRWIY